MRLDLTLFSASNVPRLDPKFRQLPYCVVELSGDDHRYQTQPSKNPTNPVWNEQFSFPQIPEKFTAKISILTKESVICELSFTIESIFIGFSNDQWFQLETAGGDSSAKIHIAMEVVAEPNDMIIAEEEEEEALEEVAPVNRSVLSTSSGQFSSPRSKSQMSPSQLSRSPKASSSKSPRVKADRTREMLVNSNNSIDINDVEKEAKKIAGKDYVAFLRENAQGLLDNSRIVSNFEKEE